MIPVSKRISSRKGKEVYEWIRQKGVISKQELQDLSGYTISTLTRVLEELSEPGLIVETGYGESTGGRRPTLYQINPTYGYVFGLDISRTISRLVLCDLHLNKVDAVCWKMTEDLGPERIIEYAVQEANRMLDKHHIPHEVVLGIGVGAVGPLDRERGIILDPQGFPAAGWSNIPICDIFGERLQIPAYLDNGANTALLGEYWCETTGRRMEHMLYVHVGVGIRSSVMVGGKIAYGAVDMEGTVGQMIIQSDGIAPNRKGGNYGAWESYVSAYALERAAKSYLKQGRASLLRERIADIDKLTYTDLERAYGEGDDLAREVYTQAAAYFGIGLANLLNILHPEKVILGGPIAGNIDLFFDDAIRIAIENTYYYPKYQVEFQKSGLADDGVAIGAAALIVQQMSA